MTRAPSAEIQAEPFDIDEPMVQRYIARVIALPPAAWEALDAGAASWAPRDGAGQIFVAALDGLNSVSHRTMNAPLWRWWGTGPVRVLAEVLERPWVTPAARSRALLGLLAVRKRRVLTPVQLRVAYASMEPVVPWASLGEPRPWPT